MMTHTCFSTAMIVMIAPAMCAGITGTDQNVLRNGIESAEGRHKIAVAEFQRVAGPAIDRMSASVDTRGFIRDLLESKERMADLMLSGPLENPGKTLRILAALTFPEKI